MSNHDAVKELRDKNRILQFLEIANKHVADLAVRIDGTNQTYSTAIIEIDAQENAISLELLRPEEGNELLHRASHADIEVYLNNSKLSWRSEVFKDDYTCIPDLFQVSIPTSVNYTQQRLAYRVETSDEINVVLSNSEMGTIHGVMLNLSVGGIAAKIPKHVIEALNPGTLFQDCIVQLPEHDVLCSIEVMHKNAGKSSFGAKFCSMSRLQQHAVSEFIAEKDRFKQRSRLSA